MNLDFYKICESTGVTGFTLLTKIAYQRITCVQMGYICYINENNYLECALLGLRQFLSTESRLKKIKNVFYFDLKALFLLKIFNYFLYSRQTIILSSRPKVFIRRGVLKICSKFTGEHPCKETLFKSHFGMGVLL